MLKDLSKSFEVIDNSNPAVHVREVLSSEPIEGDVLERFASEADRNQGLAAGKASNTSHNLYWQIEESKWTDIGRVRLYGDPGSRMVGWCGDAQTCMAGFLGFRETGECAAHAYWSLFGEILRWGEEDKARGKGLSEFISWLWYTAHSPRMLVRA